MGSNASKLHSAALEANLRVLNILVRKRGVDVETEFGANNCATSDQYRDKMVVVRAIHVAARHGYVQGNLDPIYECMVVVMMYMYIFRQSWIM